MIKDFHFILVCTIYNDYTSRLRFLKKYYWDKIAILKSLRLFNSES